MHVCVAPKFLPRLKAIAWYAGQHFPNPVLQTVQLEAREDGSGALRVTNRAGEAEVEAPLLKVARPGVVQLPTFPALRALANASRSSKVEILGLLSETFAFVSNPKAPSRKVVIRAPPKGSVALSTWKPDDFPVLAPAEFAKNVEIDAWKFRRLLTPTSPCLEAGNGGSNGRALDERAFDGDVAPHGVSSKDGCCAPAFSNAMDMMLMAPGTEVVAAAARRLLASALSSEAHKALAELLDTMEDSVLTVGITADAGEERFQVLCPGLFFVTRLLGCGRSAPLTANCPKTQFVTQQESMQEMPPAGETDSLQLCFSGRTSTMPAPKKNHEEHKDRPVRVIKMKNIRGNVWANRLPSGQVVYNVTIDRLWRQDDEVDGSGNVTRQGEWHQSQSFGRDDLLLVAKVADLCHTWIFNEIQRRARDY